MLATLETVIATAMSPGIDIELGFNKVMEGFGVSAEIAHILWLPLPMLLVLAVIAATFPSNFPIVISSSSRALVRHQC